MKSPVSAAIAIGVGVVIFLGYFLSFGALETIRAVLLDWAVALAGVAALVGIANLLGVHVNRLRRGSPSMGYSFIILAAFLVTFALGMFYGPGDPLVQQIVGAVQIPVEATLMAVLSISLIYAAIRLVQRRMNTFTIIFLGAMLLFLLIQAGIIGLGETDFMRTVLATINHLPLAGARGLLLGVALGSLTAGLRVLLGADRPYGG